MTFSCVVFARRQRRATGSGALLRRPWRICRPELLVCQACLLMIALILGAGGPARAQAASAVGAARSDSGPVGMRPPAKSLRGSPNYDQIYKRVTAARAAKRDHLTPVTSQMLETPPPGDWLSWRRGYASDGHSPLKQINTRNIDDLGVAWTWSLPVGPNEITPLVHDGVLFVESANQVQAFNGATGDLLWRYVRQLPPRFHDGRNNPFKSMAIYGDKLFAPTPDGHIVALDIRTGRVVWDHAALGRKEMAAHLRLDGGPIVADGKVIMGASGCTIYKGGCFIFALDANSGKEVWRFHTIARPGQPGGDSWNGAPLDERYGASVWTVGSYDPKLNLVYFGTGNSYDTAILLQPQAQRGKSNDALYTDSTVALDAKTGKLVWYYQHMNRDVWDMDWVFEQTLLTLPIRGKPTDLLVTGGKLAIFDVLNRTNGQYEFSKDVGLQNLVSAIDPKTGRKTISPALKPEPKATKLLCPHGGGARNWLATSFDPHTKILYIPMVEYCAKFTWIPRTHEQDVKGGSDMHWVTVTRPDTDGKIGRVEAINIETGKVVWIRRQRAPEASSILTTDGGLEFDGVANREFRAADAATGKVLWKTRLNAGVSSTPVAYSADGNEYIAVVAGGGAAREHSWSTLAPEIHVPPGGTTLWVFKLRDRHDNAKD